MLNVDLSGSDLTKASLLEASLNGANLGHTIFNEAALSGADLNGASLLGCDMQSATLYDASLFMTTIVSGDFSGTDMTKANLGGTIIVDVDLSDCVGLAQCEHHGPSNIDFQTLQRSTRLPLAFLRGVGLPDSLIDYLPSLLNQAIQLYSCFISYSAKDDEFVRRLHADLQDRGVRCWFAPEDMKIGAKILDTLDQAIRLRDKVVLVLSGASIASDWVEDEVTKAFAEERQRGGVTLMPVRIDDAVFETNEAWAVKLRDGRNIGDFRGWEQHDAYKKALDRLIRDLRVEAAG